MKPLEKVKQKIEHYANEIESLTTDIQNEVNDIESFENLWLPNDEIELLRRWAVYNGKENIDDIKEIIIKILDELESK